MYACMHACMYACIHARTYIQAEMGLSDCSPTDTKQSSSNQMGVHLVQAGNTHGNTKW